VSALARALTVGLIALTGLLAGFAAYRLATQESSPGALAAAHLHAAAPDSAHPPGEAEAPDNEAARTKPVPETLPDVRLPDLAGKSVALQDYLGRPLIINFWATWCAPCRREMPLLQSLQHEFAQDRLQIVGVAVDFQASVQEYLRTHTIDYPILIGETDGLAVIEQFGMEPVLPVSVFADAKGRIVLAKVGELHRTEADYILSQMRAIAAGSESLAQGRRAIAERLKALAIERAKTPEPAS